MSTDNKTDEKTYVVYCHTCPDGKYYGVTCNIKSRWYPSQYKETSLKPYIDKYGWDAIKHEVLYSGLTRDEALKIEDELICKARESGTCINQFRSGHYQQTDIFKYENNSYQKAWHKEHRKTNPEECRARDKAYYDSHKDVILAKQRERRKRKKGGGDKPEPLF